MSKLKQTYIAASLSLIPVFFGYQEYHEKKQKIQDIEQEYAQYNKQDKELRLLAQPSIEEATSFRSQGKDLPANLEKKLEDISEDILNNMKVLNAKNARIQAVEKTHPYANAKLTLGLVLGFGLAGYAMYSMKKEQSYK